MRSSVTIDKEILDELLRVTKAKSKAKAVKMAIFEYLRRKEVEKITSMKNKLSFNSRDRNTHA